ncbi:M14 family zinc carboxypeptidase [Nocardioides piscis]|uniref:Murein peptide amidase A n=1 Tax=Nocardioides piscis TaxID=2714938 RepID=A0A6G7YBU4_9ACTN|nr:M14 family zinc carboxypeptidase [Nocardioides piscis]QIK74146.1 murein peptide amidase A [Nocardioides piscis]
MTRRAVAAALLLGLVLPWAPASTYAAQDTPPRAVVERAVIGTSVAGRPIRAWRLGEPGRRRVVLVSTMHGNEPHTRQILTSLRDGRRIRGIDLWVVPTYNPDGLARHTRRNARGVDLNRNYPNDWVDLDGSHESGTGPASEPETRALMRFLRRVDPVRLISFHQPLVGVDTDTKDPRFARRLARELRLPRTRLDCGGRCHGTMTGWFNANFTGSALTVEYGARPTRHRMVVQAPRQLLRALGARRVGR